MKILAVADEECKALWDYFTPTSSRASNSSLPAAI